MFVNLIDYAILMQPDNVDLMLKHEWMKDIPSFGNAWITCADVLSVILLKSMLEKQNAEREEAVMIIWNGMQSTPRRSPSSVQSQQIAPLELPWCPPNYLDSDVVVSQKTQEDRLIAELQKGQSKLQRDRQLKFPRKWGKIECVQKRRLNRKVWKMRCPLKS